MTDKMKFTIGVLGGIVGGLLSLSVSLHLGWNLLISLGLSIVDGYLLGSLVWCLLNIKRKQTNNI
ncbi:hypothetical protein [Bacillus cereus group sp. N21]|uniref:hypothetical protein n=1 Tax=Bacillus cereus group sp. N21 TaxID=2794591 RepID=UPI0018F2F50D|nr:hypothetical protein [Bacillus cereus group sp. N21]MBJ8031903.1 hypothetical protein [Bacillus cereus group sp. N21]